VLTLSYDSYTSSSVEKDENYSGDSSSNCFDVVTDLSTRSRFIIGCAAQGTHFGELGPSYFSHLYLDVRSFPAIIHKILLVGSHGRVIPPSLFVKGRT
jgi:hypothetical protein